MTSELEKLIERARKRKMTPAERFEQRVSFVYGQATDCGWTKEQIREHLRSLG